MGIDSFVGEGCARCANSDSFLDKTARHAGRLVRGFSGLLSGRHRGNKMLSISARAISSLIACTPNCLSGRGRLVINLRASDPLHQNMGPFNNVHVTHRTTGTCNCRLSSGVRSRFECGAARGSKMFETCADRVEGTHRVTLLANLPSTCKENEVVKSCHEITLCNVSALVRFGGTSGVTLRGGSVARRIVELHRRLRGRLGFVRVLGRVTRVCNCSVSSPTDGTHRTVR